MHSELKDAPKCPEERHCHFEKEEGGEMKLCLGSRKPYSGIKVDMSHGQSGAIERLVVCREREFKRRKSC